MSNCVHCSYKDDMARCIGSGCKFAVEPSAFQYLAKAFLDVLDGNQEPHEIKYMTGLDDSRCQELNTLFKLLLRKHNGP